MTSATTTLIPEVWFRTDAELVADVAATLALRAQIDGLLLAQVGEVDSRGIPARRGCPTTRAWLRSAHRIAPTEASSLVKTALALRDDLPGWVRRSRPGSCPWPKPRSACTPSPTYPRKPRSPGGRRPRPR